MFVSVLLTLLAALPIEVEDGLARVYRNLAYGEDPLQQLDLYLPKPQPKEALPLVVMVHGGAWVTGDKSHRNVGANKARWANNNQWAFASLNYRLAPDDPHPAAVEDVISALAWLRKESEQYGIDPNRILLMGHSAGAHLVALAAVSRARLENHGVPQSCLRGVVVLDTGALDLISIGNFFLEKLPEKLAIYEAPFGPFPLDEIQEKSKHPWADASPIYHVQVDKPRGSNWLSGDKNGLAINHIPPFFIVTTEDRRLARYSSVLFAEEVAKWGFPVQWEEALGYDHSGINEAVGQSKDPWTKRVEEFYGRCLQDWLVVQKGDCNLVLSAPHDGGEMPEYIATRTKGVTVRDSAAQEIMIGVAEQLSKKKKRPFFVTTHLRRKKMDANRAQEEATQGDPWAAHAWRRYHIELEAACNEALKLGDGRALLLDFHAQGHPNNWFEVGHAISASGLKELSEKPDEVLTPWVHGKSSFGALLSKQGFRAVPSPEIPHPNGEKYFTGGFITRRYRSSAHPIGGLRSIQIEMPSLARKKQNRPQTISRLSKAILEFMKSGL